MTTTAPAGATAPATIRLADLRPYFKVTVLRCVTNKPDQAFNDLATTLHRLAEDRGRAIAVRITGEAMVTDPGNDIVNDVEAIRRLGFDRLYAVTRERAHRPTWVTTDSLITDVTNEVIIALRRNDLVAVLMPNPDSVLTWLDTYDTPYRRLPANIMASTFDGDGKALWLRGVHRRRPTKPDSKMLTGARLQAAVDPVADATFAMSATRLDFAPTEDITTLKGDITVSPDRSRLSWRQVPSFQVFLVAVGEALALLDKALADENTDRVPYVGLAVPETNSASVRDAFDIRVADPDEVRGEPGADDTQAERAELLRRALLDVQGDPGSSTFRLTVGLDGYPSGWLDVRLVPSGDSHLLAVRNADRAINEETTKDIRRAIGTGDLLTVYYQSGHALTANRLLRQDVTSTPFANLQFADFAGFNVAREKPAFRSAQDIHDHIGQDNDNSLFGWVVRTYQDGWLICDDGSGEIADFLYLCHDGTLSAIHVKGAHTASPSRQVAVTAYEQVASQAGKNVRLLATDALVERLASPRVSRPACWYAGQRIADRTEFIDMLRDARGASDRTNVIIVQPHLTQLVHGQARTAAKAGRPTKDSRSLMLLDDLLHTTRATVRALWDDLVVIGCA